MKFQCVLGQQIEFNNSQTPQMILCSIAAFPLRPTTKHVFNVWQFSKKFSFKHQQKSEDFNFFFNFKKKVTHFSLTGEERTPTKDDQMYRRKHSNLIWWTEYFPSFEFLKSAGFFVGIGRQGIVGFASNYFLLQGIVHVIIRVPFSLWFRRYPVRSYFFFQRFGCCRWVVYVSSCVGNRNVRRNEPKISWPIRCVLQNEKYSHFLTWSFVSLFTSIVKESTSSPEAAFWSARRV